MSLAFAVNQKRAIVFIYASPHPGLHLGLKTNGLVLLRCSAGAKSLLMHAEAGEGNEKGY